MRQVRTDWVAGSPVVELGLQDSPLSSVNVVMTPALSWINCFNVPDFGPGHKEDHLVGEATRIYRV